LFGIDWLGRILAGHSGSEPWSRWSAHSGRTYWDYTQLRFARREGMRIDFVLGSPALAARVTNALMDRQERKGKGASDHAPVVVDLHD
jgi:exonuclease III